MKSWEGKLSALPLLDKTKLTLSNIEMSGARYVKESSFQTISGEPQRVCSMIHLYSGPGQSIVAGERRMDNDGRPQRNRNCVNASKDKNLTPRTLYAGQKRGA
jgi:hypothetical protein